jgi:hypothetical protein
MEKKRYITRRRYDRICFYVVAHADDWQLFMQQNVFEDIRSPRCKVIFIITSAGDAGKDKSYWLAREEGLKSSTRFCLAPVSPLSEFPGNSIFNGFNIHWWTLNNSTSYFLRLPDGNLDGNGFASNNFQSLAKLESGQINVLPAVNNSAVYYNWGALVKTIESIIIFESNTISDKWIHYLDPNPVANPDDHPDHIATGKAIQQMNIISSLRQLIFSGYSTKMQPEERSPEELFWKAGMFAVYEKAVHDFCGYSTLHENIELYLKWCSRQLKYFTILPEYEREFHKLS